MWSPSPVITLESYIKDVEPEYKYLPYSYLNLAKQKVILLENTSQIFQKAVYLLNHDLNSLAKQQNRQLSMTFRVTPILYKDTVLLDIKNIFEGNQNRFVPELLGQDEIYFVGSGELQTEIYFQQYLEKNNSRYIKLKKNLRDIDFVKSEIKKCHTKLIPFRYQDESLIKNPLFLKLYKQYKKSHLLSTPFDKSRLQNLFRQSLIQVPVSEINDYSFKSKIFHIHNCEFQLGEDNQRNITFIQNFLNKIPKPINYINISNKIDSEIFSFYDTKNETNSPFTVYLSYNYQHDKNC